MFEKKNKTEKQTLADYSVGFMFNNPKVTSDDAKRITPLVFSLLVCLFICLGFLLVCTL